LHTWCHLHLFPRAIHSMSDQHTEVPLLTISDFIRFSLTSEINVCKMSDVRYVFEMFLKLLVFQNLTHK
jgi:hypothetical protein